MIATKTSKNLDNLKICAGKNCPNKGGKLLKIRYIHQEGWFCKNCTKELSKEGLIEEEDFL